jgi:hypothetical protein
MYEFGYRRTSTQAKASRLDQKLEFENRRRQA